MDNFTDDDVLQSAMMRPVKSGAMHVVKNLATQYAPKLLPAVKAAGRVGAVGTVASLLESKPLGAASMSPADYAKLERDHKQREWLAQQPGYEKPGEAPASFHQQSRAQLTGAPTPYGKK